MLMSTIHTFDLRTGAFINSRPAQVVGGKELTVCANATPVAPPTDIPTGHAARWTGSAWEVVEDHRQHMDSKGTKIGGTPYWQPAEGDDWQSPPRYTEELGPLPEGAVTERPKKPLSVLKAEKEREITAACDAAIVASLTMPTSAPSSAEVAVAAASLASIDPDGPDTLLALHTARRDELLAAVAAADSTAALADVEVSYAV
ncbi:phage tail protein [Desulfovibrio fairfieldensis]|uniref:Phage tail protein n=2 Tax=Desulfovibrio fairfieldensis TaxID=44742 RepID=A0A0X8JJG0_9BACT|nr:phage tail protein [Desulfovibrio fairfieldensis]